MTTDGTIELARRTYPSVSSVLWAWIDKTGLVVAGQDVGPGVEAVWGDTDYEYWVVVDAGHLDLVLAGLWQKLGREPVDGPDRNSRDRQILELLGEAFQGEIFGTDTDYRRWLDSLHIPSTFSNYA